jgi:hypothetical protein
MKVRQILAIAALVIGLGSASVAKADPMCVSQQVVAGLACSLGDLTFTFEAVTLTGTGNSLFLETPPTSAGGGVTTLGFQVLASYPVDIHLVYEVQSTSTNITALDSGFIPVEGNPPPGGQIAESACGSDPLLHEGTCTPLLASVTNSTGAITYTASFGPVSTVWVDKDITDNGFSSFTDSIQTSATPEPSSIALFGTGLLAAAGALRRRLA